MDREEGEMSDDNAMHVDDDEENILVYKAEKVGVFVEKLEKVDAVKLEERAKRFGLNLTGARVVTQKQIDELYANCGMKNGNERHFRFDTLHLSEVDGLRTSEIFEYLEDFKPVSLEWINDSSCNIVCQDHISAALALLVHSRDIKHTKEILQDKSDHHWREGMPHPKKDLILMRFATNSDKKVSKKKNTSKYKMYDSSISDNIETINKNPWGDLCKSWGVYDHQEIFSRKLPEVDSENDDINSEKVIKIKNKRLATRLGIKRHNYQSEDSSSDSEWTRKSKAPRMRMHADDEETKQIKKLNDSDEEPDLDTHAPLSIEVVNTESNYTPRNSTKLSDKFKYHSKCDKPIKNNVHSRLGLKVVPTEGELSSDGYSTEDSSHFIMSRVQKVSESSVWSRLESKSAVQNDLRNVLKSRGQKKSDDLRGIIGRSKKSNLRIEIDNNYTCD